MYIIKVKGRFKIPDYIQIRDEKFVLLAYFRADNPKNVLERFGIEGKDEAFSDLIKTMPYGKIQPLTL